MRNYLFIFLCCFFIFFGCKKESALVNDVGTVFNFSAFKVDSAISIGDIYQTNNFAAFTDIAYFNGLWYTVFRIGTSHDAGENGQIKVLTSTNGLSWKVMNNISVHGFDLRDPKLTIDSLRNNLYLSFFGRNVLKHGVDIENYITQLDNATNTWQPIKQIQYNKVNGNQYVFWRYTYYKEKMYCIAYRAPVGIDSIKNLCLFISDNNFLSYKSVSILDLTKTSSETTLRFAANDSMYFIARTERINSPIGISLPDYKKTTWINNALSVMLASPDFLFYKNKLLITGRDSKQRTFRFFSYDLNSKKVQKNYTFPSGYETGYGGMSFNPNNPDELWITYYSVTNNSSSIKLAKINLHAFL